MKTKHTIVKEKTTFERFKPRVDRKLKGLKIYPSTKIHYCDGTKRGAKFKHPPMIMRRSGFAQSGHNLLQRFECPCGFKTTFGKEG